MVGHVLAAASRLEPQSTIVVVGPCGCRPKDVAPHPAIVQENQSGTRDAVKVGISALSEMQTALSLCFRCGPLIRTETLAGMVDAREAGAAVVVLGFRAANPSGYGRLIVDATGALQSIVEDKDATPAQCEIDLCNAGAMALDASLLRDLLEQIRDDNAKGEFYLTDIVGLARAGGLACSRGRRSRTMGVDSVPTCAEAFGRQRREAMASSCCSIRASISLTTRWT